MITYWKESSTGDAWRNLAEDEYWLDHLPPEALLIYLYVNHRAVIIGRNQNPWRECDTAAMERDGVQLARRCTGGGAVYHDRGNLNFSFIGGAARYDVGRQTDRILRAVRALGIPAERNGRNDLTVEGRKFSGQAFCTRGGVSQHHGTLLVSTELEAMGRYLTVSAEKLRAKGVASVRSRVCNLSELCPALTVERLAGALRQVCTEELGTLTPLPDAPPAALETYIGRHASWDWRMGASPDFDFSASRRFDWGEAQLYLRVSQGRVTETRLDTDALDPLLPERVAAALTGCRYAPALLRAALLALGGEARELAELMDGVPEE